MGRGSWCLSSAASEDGFKVPIMLLCEVEKIHEC